MKLLLLASLSISFLAIGGMSRYRASTQEARVDAVRRSLAAQAARVNEAIQSGECANFQQIGTELQRIRKESRNRIAWIQLRDDSGVVRSRVGTRAFATFPLDAARSQLQQLRPVFRIVHTQAGAVLLEAFTVKLPEPRRRGVSILTVAGETELFGVVEIAAPLGSTAPLYHQLFPNFL